MVITLQPLDRILGNAFEEDVMVELEDVYMIEFLDGSDFTNR
jgi:hypothetical protein